MSAAIDTEHEPRFEAGWMPCKDDVRGTSFAAFLRPASQDWYEMFHLPTWWEAQKHAQEIADRIGDCEFIGGPGFHWGSV